MRARVIRAKPARLDAPAPDHPGLALVRFLRGADWLAEAACGDDPNPDDWFREGSSRDREGLGSKRALRAFLICSGCPVREPCLTEAITSRPQGIWGATTEGDRRAVCHLSTEVAVKRLERGRKARLRKRIAAYRRRNPNRPLPLS